MRDLPEGHGEVQETDAGHRTAHPARRDGVLQAGQPRLVREIDEKEIVAPVRQPERMRPRQKRQDEARLKAQDDVEDDGQLRRHG
ncbi:MAG: hypothetical protein DMF64_10460 [Acidobacteria bacterium]|nr:MAG: hypothetical protein DMF64_10460 [Acidobacteriota bacterium]